MYTAKITNLSSGLGVKGLVIYGLLIITLLATSCKKKSDDPNPGQNQNNSQNCGSDGCLPCSITAMDSSSKLELEKTYCYYDTDKRLIKNEKPNGSDNDIYWFTYANGQLASIKKKFISRVYTTDSSRMDFTYNNGKLSGYSYVNLISSSKNKTVKIIYPAAQKAVIVTLPGGSKSDSVYLDLNESGYPIVSELGGGYTTIGVSYGRYLWKRDSQNRVIKSLTSFTSTDTTGSQALQFFEYNFTKNSFGGATTAAFSELRKFEEVLRIHNEFNYPCYGNEYTKQINAPNTSSVNTTNFYSVKNTGTCLQEYTRRTISGYTSINQATIYKFGY